MWISRDRFEKLEAAVKAMQDARDRDQQELSQRIEMTVSQPHGFFGRARRRPVTEVVEAILSHLGLELGVARSVPERIELRKLPGPMLTFTGTVTGETISPPKRRKSRTK